MQREHRLRTAWGRKERCDRKFHICNRHTLIYTIDLILIKGTQGNYIPWQTSDFEGLISRLPDINEGVGKWIKHMKGESVGKILSVADICLWMASSVKVDH